MSKHGLLEIEAASIVRPSKKLKTNGVESHSETNGVSGKERRKSKKDRKEKKRDHEGRKEGKGEGDRKRKNREADSSPPAIAVNGDASPGQISSGMATNGVSSAAVTNGKSTINGGVAVNGESKSSTDVTNLSSSNSRVVTNGEYLASVTDVASTSNSRVAAFFAKENVRIWDPRSKSAATLEPILDFAQLPPFAPAASAEGASDRKEKKKKKDKHSQGRVAVKSSLTDPFAAFKAPTPIQSAAWPYVLAGRDVVGVAETGSGKTLAFGWPVARGVLALASEEDGKDASSDDEKNVVRAVVLSPTRELAMQTHAALESLCEACAPDSLHTVCLFGGASKQTQLALLNRRRPSSTPSGRRKGFSVLVVATPGRLLDFLTNGQIDLSRARFVVLDEADRMLDTGFEQHIRQIVGACPPREKRQTLMFTATWPSEVRDLAATFMVDAARVVIGQSAAAAAVLDENGVEVAGAGASDTHQLQANRRIEQRVEVCSPDPRAKEARLLAILREHQRGGARDRILVFCLYKKEAVRVEQFLRQRGGSNMRVVSIHGDLRQDKRTQALDAFKKGDATVLVATDVAARGLDIPEVKLVINVTFPLTIEDYVHRIGRTGRAGKTGLAITLFTEYDKSHSGELINILKAANQPVPEELLKFGTTVKKKQHDAYGAFFRDVDRSKTGTKITFD